MRTTAISGKIITTLRNIVMRSHKGHDGEYFCSQDQGGTDTWKIACNRAEPSSKKGGRSSHKAALADCFELRMANFNGH